MKAFGRDDEARAQRLAAALRLRALALRVLAVEEVAEEFLERRAGRKLRRVGTALLRLLLLTLALTGRWACACAGAAVTTWMLTTAGSKRSARSAKVEGASVVAIGRAGAASDGEGAAGAGTACGAWA